MPKNRHGAVEASRRISKNIREREEEDPTPAPGWGRGKEERDTLHFQEIFGNKSTFGGHMTLSSY